MASATTKTRTFTFPRLTLIISAIKIAYKRIMGFTDEKMENYIEAFRNKELKSVTFYAVTKQDGTDKKLIEFEIAIDWVKHKELVSLIPDIVLKNIPEHKDGITIEINEAINAYLELFEIAKEKFPDCCSEAWYSRSNEVKSDPELLKIAEKRVPLSSNSKALEPYQKQTSDSNFDSRELGEVSAKLKTYFD